MALCTTAGPLAPHMCRSGTAPFLTTLVNREIVSITSSNGLPGDVVADLSDDIFNAGASGQNFFNDGGTITSHGFNLSNDDGGGFLNGPGDQIDTDPLVGPLQDNGGPTFTHALLLGNPAIDSGNPNFTPPPFFDQRGTGYPRVVNGRLDKGSFE